MKCKECGHEIESEMPEEVWAYKIGTKMYFEHQPENEEYGEFGTPYLRKDIVDRDKAELEKQIELLQESHPDYQNFRPAKDQRSGEDRRKTAYGDCKAVDRGGLGRRFDWRYGRRAEDKPEKWEQTPDVGISDWGARTDEVTDGPDNIMDAYWDEWKAKAKAYREKHDPRSGNDRRKPPAEVTHETVMDRTLWWKDAAGDWFPVERYVPGLSAQYRIRGNYHSLTWFIGREHTRCPQ